MARHQLAAMLVEQGWPGDVDSVVLAVHEAIINAQLHGGGLSWLAARLDGPTLEVEVCDRGPIFDIPPRRADPNPYAESGRGLWIIWQVASRCELRHDGTSVCLTLRFDSRGGG